MLVIKQLPQLFCLYLINLLFVNAGVMTNVGTGGSSGGGGVGAVARFVGATAPWCFLHDIVLNKAKLMAMK